VVFFVAPRRIEVMPRQIGIPAALSRTAKSNFRTKQADDMHWRPSRKTHQSPAARSKHTPRDLVILVAAKADNTIPPPLPPRARIRTDGPEWTPSLGKFLSEVMMIDEGR
jgi:hypothetical protein